MDTESNSAQLPRKINYQQVVADCKQLHARAAPSTYKLGLSSTDLRDQASKQDGKRLLIHSDSGYISPTVAPASSGNSPQTPSKEPLKVTFQSGTISEEPRTSSLEVVSADEKSIEQEKANRTTSVNMQRVVVENRVEHVQRSLAADSPMEGHHVLENDLLLLAYECRQSNMGTWACCPHPYCVFIRQMSQHFNDFRNSHNHTCEKCSNWADMLTRHMNACTDAHCPIQMCRNSRNHHQTSTAAQFQFGGSKQQSVDNSSGRSTRHSLQNLGRSSSFTAADVDDNTSMSSLLSSRGVGSVFSSLARASLRAKAEEIVNRLEQEEPFSSDLVSSASRNQPIPPHSLPTHPGQMSGDDSAHYHAQIGVQQQMMLSPIAEQPGTEDVSPGYSSIHPSLSHTGSQPQFPSLGSGFSSYEMDGPGHTSIGGASVPSQSMKLGVEKSQEDEEPHVVYPKQKLLQRLNPEYLTPGPDGCYYKIRDYNLNEVDLLGTGGFGSCMCAQDNTTNKMFAIKQNKNENYKSIEDECYVLSLIPHHDNVVHFLGAVIDERDLPTQPPHLYRMMMELADNGDLTELFKDEFGEEAPLPEDQSLYYLQQILRGVNFLHQNGFLHLDIKAKNVLVFDGGRTVKLTDFGSAVRVGEATAMKKGMTAYFAAPEVVKGDVPHFSADIWSTLCILVEMLTTKLPGCYQHHSMTDVAMMFLVGSYEDNDIQKLIPLDNLDVKEEVKQLFRDVFVKDPSSRPTAMDLLKRPIISSAEEYAIYFDESCDSEDSEELDSISTKGGDYSSMEPGVAEVSHISTMSSNQSMSSLGDKVGDLPCFNGSQGSKRNGNGSGRGSQDSGVGGDLESSFTGSVVFGAQLSMRSSSSSSTTQQHWMQQDSGLEDMTGSQPERCATSYFTSRQRSGSLNRPNGYTNLNFSSLPPAPSTQTPEYSVVQRSFSFGGRSFKRSESYSRSQTRASSGLGFIAKRQRPNSIHPKLHLTHSQSAPSISLDPWRRRRHSLQHLDSYGTGETWETDTEVDGVNPMGKSLLRRTSSEVYVDRGPDIDTPEKEKSRLQELMSTLNIGSTHSPKRSAPCPTPAVARQTSDAGIQCDTQSATSSLSSTSTASNEIADTKKHADDGERDDDHPPSNGSQAFQIC